MKSSNPPLFISLLISVIICTSCSHSGPPQSVQAAIDTLDLTLASRYDSIESRRAYAARMSRLCTVKPSTDNYLLAAEAFDGINNDSAIVYTNMAINVAVDSNRTDKARLIAIDFARRLAKSTLIVPAVNILNRISVDSLDNTGKIKFYSIKSDIYIDAANDQTLKYLHRQYTEKAINALDSLLSLTDPSSTASHVIEARLNYLRGKTSLASGELDEVLDSISTTDPMYPAACSLIATLYKNNPDKQYEYLYYLTLASIAESRNIEAENGALIKLGAEFFRQGDLDRAYIYLSASGEHIVNAKSKHLYQQIAPTMPFLVEAIQARDKKRAEIMISLISALALTVAVCGVILWHIARKNTRRRIQNHRLNASITSRDLYIKQLLDLCSVYVDGLEDFNRLVSRKLKVNQTQDLYKMIESGKMIQDQTDRFFEVFDNAISNIYPSFITELNTLLQPDRQIAPTSDGRLTPELRIVAFMRLGVNDSTRLSKFLGLSLNTVYTYRNRMKSRAKNRESFDTDIFKIGKNA